MLGIITCHRQNSWVVCIKSLEFIQNGGGRVFRPVALHLACKMRQLKLFLCLFYIDLLKHFNFILISCMYGSKTKTYIPDIASMTRNASPGSSFSSEPSGQSHVPSINKEPEIQCPVPQRNWVIMQATKKQKTGPRLNIKTVFRGMGISIMKKRRLIVIMEIPILGRWRLCIETRIQTTIIPKFKK